MSVDEVMIQVKPEILLEDNYTLLPYIKVAEDNMLVLNSDLFKEDVSVEKFLCVPTEDTLFDCSIGTSFIEQHSESEYSLNDYNSNTAPHENVTAMYWTHDFERESAKLKCTFCQKVMKTPAAFYRHSRIHTGEKPFQCQLCDKKFSQQSNLWKHVLIHTGERRYECSQCGKKFSQRANMQKHMMVHTGEKPFSCFICSRTFTQRANLNKHIRIHTGEKPYICKYCNRSFAQQSNMQKHEMIHKGVRPFSCTICAATFTQQSNLKKHLEVHSEKHKSNVALYTCHACSKLYKTLDSLYKHMTMCPQIEDAKIVIEVDGNETEDNDTEKIYVNVAHEDNKPLPIINFF